MCEDGSIQIHIIYNFTLTSFPFFLLHKWPKAGPSGTRYTKFIAPKVSGSSLLTSKFKLYSSMTVDECATLPSGLRVTATLIFCLNSPGVPDSPYSILHSRCFSHSQLYARKIIPATVGWELHPRFTVTSVYVKLKDRNPSVSGKKDQNVFWL